MNKYLKNDWNHILENEFNADYFHALTSFLSKECAIYNIYPIQEDIFAALQLTPYSNVKVVLIGQDPYHGENQAHGLCFSVKPNVKIPPSLRNIFKELHSDIGCEIPQNGYLTSWAMQGVLMLNTVLTVRSGEANSHKNKGWELFTDKIIEKVNEKEIPVVFVLWGNNAIEKEKLITNGIHYVIKSTHPSPFSAHRGFLGSKPFSKTNDYLEEVGHKKINWCT